MVDYCTLLDVKPILMIDLAVTTEDVELADCIHDATIKAENLLKASGLDMPLEVPDAVKIAAKNFAAWLYRRRRDPEAAQIFYYEASEALNGYMAAEKSDEVKPYVGMV